MYLHKLCGFHLHNINETTTIHIRLLHKQIPTVCPRLLLSFIVRCFIAPTVVKYFLCTFRMSIGSNRYHCFVIITPHLLYMRLILYLHHKLRIISWPSTDPRAFCNYYKPNIRNSINISKGTLFKNNNCKLQIYIHILV